MGDSTRLSRIGPNIYPWVWYSEIGRAVGFDAENAYFCRESLSFFAVFYRCYSDIFRDFLWVDSSKVPATFRAWLGMRRLSANAATCPAVNI
jgi:hypothetical protein